MQVKVKTSNNSIIELVKFRQRYKSASLLLNALQGAIFSYIFLAQLSGWNDLDSILFRDFHSNSPLATHIK